MRLSLALSAIAGGLVLGWAGLASADAPASAPPAAPIFYCPTPPAAPAPAATPAAHHHDHDGPACPTPHSVAVDHHRHVRHHEQTVVREETPPIVEDHHGRATGHMFWFRYQDALNNLGPSCPDGGRPCPPEPPPPIVRWRGAPQDGAYAQLPPPPAPPPMGPPCPRVHHTCPPVGQYDGGYAQIGPPPAPPPPPIDSGPPCPRVHHTCPPLADYDAQIIAPPPPPPSVREEWRAEQRRAEHAYAEAGPPLAPPPADNGPPCPRIHHTCPPVSNYDGGYAQAAPPPPAPPPVREAWREERRDDRAYAETPPPAPPPAFAERHDGYAYQRSESEHTSGWSYSEQDGQGHYQHWDDGDGRRPPPPCPRQGCRADPPAYADAPGQWQDGSYGHVYPVAGRDAEGYLVWPGKTPQ